MIDAADLARFRLAVHHDGLHDRHAASALAAQWPLAMAVPELGALLDPAQVEALPADLDSELAHVVRGWARYYEADYEGAAAAFARALEAGVHWQAWSRLGLGKVCSDLGSWDRARQWLVSALALAREQGDLPRMAECLGSIGEIFVRAGRPREGMEVLDLDAGLLPPGSGHQLRLQNYRAIALGRLGRVDLAIPQLWESTFTALPRDPISALYSLASLDLCALLSDDVALRERIARTRVDFGAQFDSVTEFAQMPLAVGRLCAAASQWGDSARPEAPAVDALTDAANYLEQRYPLEHLWVRSLLSRDGSASQEQQWSALAARSVGPDPGTPRVSAVDLWTLDVPLPETDLLTKVRRTVDSGQDGPTTIRNGLSLWFV